MNKAKINELEKRVETDEQRDEPEVSEEDRKKVEETADEMLSGDGVWTFALEKTLVYDDEEYTELHFDFTKLSGEDALNIFDELAASGKPIFMNKLANSRYIMMVAVHACKEPIDFKAMCSLGIRDFDRIEGHARNFMLRFAT